MLQQYGDKVGVPQELLIPDVWPNYNAMKVALYRHADKPYGVKRLQRGCNSRQMLVDFDTLPKEVQKQLGDPRRPDHILDKYYTTDQDAVEYYHNFQYPDGSHLKPDSISQYIVNASMMKALLKLGEERKQLRESMRDRSSVTKSLCADAISYQDHLLAKTGLNHKLPTHPRRFRQALTAFENESYISLIKDAKGAAKKNAVKVDDRVEELLNAIFVSQNHKPHMTEVYHQYDGFLRGEVEVFNQETGEQYSAEGYPSISDRTVKRWLSKWHNRIGNDHLRSGDRQKYMNKYSVYHSFRPVEYAGEIISVDDRQPPFEYEPGKRMWWYLGIDLGSEAITTWAFGKSKEGIIEEFYRNMWRNYTEWNLPLPKELEAESSLNSSFKDTFLKEGHMFQTVRIEANKARAKRIEAHFRQLRYGIEKKREGWIARPFAISEANQVGRVQKQTIPYEQLVDECFNDIITWNNMEHSKHPGKSRWEVFQEMQHPDLKPINHKAVVPVLGEKTNTSVNVGIIRFRSREWLLGFDGKPASGDTLIRLMQEVEGQNITIHWLDDREGKVVKAFVYHNNRYVCDAVAKPTYSRSQIGRKEGDEEARQLMSAYANTVDNYRKQSANSIEKVALLDNRSLTISNSFTIPGKERNRPADANYEPQEPEVLPEINEDEDYSNVPQTSFKQSLKDRF